MFHVKHPLTPEAFARVTGVGADALFRLSLYLALLEKWQRRINLVGASTLADPWRRHMLDAAQLLPLLPAADPDRPRHIADLGSGAGFPGLVLAILGGGAVTLVESDARKSAFLREAIRATEAPAHVATTRIEALPPLAADVVTARACAPLPRLAAHVARHLAPDGTALLLKGAEAAAELTQAGKTWMMTASLMPSQSDPSGHVIKLTALRPR